MFRAVFILCTNRFYDWLIKLACAGRVTKSHKNIPIPLLRSLSCPCGVAPRVKHSISAIKSLVCYNVRQPIGPFLTYWLVISPLYRNRIHCIQRETLYTISINVNGVSRGGPSYPERPLRFSPDLHGPTAYNVRPCATLCCVFIPEEARPPLLGRGVFSHTSGARGYAHCVRHDLREYDSPSCTDSHTRTPADNV